MQFSSLKYPTHFIVEHIALRHMIYDIYEGHAELTLQFLTSISNVLQFEQPLYARSIALHE
jgi:hypothetical protein